MKLLYQRRKTDCAVVCFAMLMGISYWRALILLHGLKWIIPFVNLQTPLTKIIGASKKLGRELECVSIGPHSTVDRIETNAIVVVSFDAGKTSHAVVWNLQHKNSTIQPCIINSRTNRSDQELCIYYMNKENRI